MQEVLRPHWRAITLQLVVTHVGSSRVALARENPAARANPDTHRNINSVCRGLILIRGISDGRTEIYKTKILGSRTEVVN